MLLILQEKNFLKQELNLESSVFQTNVQTITIFRFLMVYLNNLQFYNRFSQIIEEKNFNVNQELNPGLYGILYFIALDCTCMKEHIKLNN